MSTILLKDRTSNRINQNLQYLGGGFIKLRYKKGCFSSRKTTFDSVDLTASVLIRKRGHTSYIGTTYT